MITSTLDPISMNDVTDLENAPFVIEGEGKHPEDLFRIRGKPAGIPGYPSAWFGWHVRFKRYLLRHGGQSEYRIDQLGGNAISARYSRL